MCSTRIRSESFISSKTLYFIFVTLLGTKRNSKKIADQGDCLSEIPRDFADALMQYRHPETEQPITEYDDCIKVKMLDDGDSYRTSQRPLARRKLDFYETCHSLKMLKPKEHPSYPGKKHITLSKYKNMSRAIPRQG